MTQEVDSEDERTRRTSLRQMLFEGHSSWDHVPVMCVNQIWEFGLSLHGEEVFGIEFHCPCKESHFLEGEVVVVENGAVEPMAGFRVQAFYEDETNTVIDARLDA